MNKSYNPEYYGTPESQGNVRDLYEGEINVAENIENESEAKESIIEPDESIFSPLVVPAPRDLYDTEINVVENLENMEESKGSVISPEESDSETVEEEVYRIESENKGPRDLYEGEISVVENIQNYETNKDAIISAPKYN